MQILNLLEISFIYSVSNVNWANIMPFNFDACYEHHSGPVIQERRMSCIYVRRSTWCSSLRCVDVFSDNEKYEVWKNDTSYAVWECVVYVQLYFKCI